MPRDRVKERAMIGERMIREISKRSSTLAQDLQRVGLSPSQICALGDMIRRRLLTQPALDQIREIYDNKRAEVARELAHLRNAVHERNVETTRARIEEGLLGFPHSSIRDILPTAQPETLVERDPALYLND